MIELSATEHAVLQRDLATAQDALATARDAETPLRMLAELTIAIEVLTAMQHELVTGLLDGGASWADIGSALSTSAVAAKRRYPRGSPRTGQT